MNNLQFGDMIVSPGKRAQGKLGTIYLYDGTQVDLPLMAVRGVEEGPILWLGAAMHGQELSGIGVIWELLKTQLNPQELKGTVIGAPLLNPLSFAGGTYFTPQDGYNINRVFPGDPGGLMTSRMANFVVEEGVKKADYLIDFHSNPEPAMYFSLVDGPVDKAPGKESLSMARAFGVTTIEVTHDLESHRTGTMTETAYQLGKPTLVVELTPWWRISKQAVRVGVRGVLNVMKSIGMLNGEIEPQEEIRVLTGRLSRTETLATRGGLVQMYKEPGEPVNKGDVVGQVVDHYGDPIEDIVSPVNGWLLAFPLMYNQAACTGELTAMFAFEK